MRLAGVQVGQLTPAHVAALVDNRVGESRIVEFKLTLPGSSSDDKKEFLADVSALANTVGGVVVYGVETERDAKGVDTGVANKIVGLPGANSDKEKQRLSAMLHDGIAPSLASHIALQDLTVPGASGPVVVLGVSQSLARPHMISFNKNGKFWRRSDSGKYQPDIEELRMMFREAESWVTDAEAFRSFRVSQVRARREAPPLSPDACLFLHVLPLGRLQQRVDLAAREEKLRTVLRPMDSRGYSSRFNADGFQLFYNGAGNVIQSFTQWFRSGGVEGYDGKISGTRNFGGEDDVKLLYATAVCDNVRSYVREAVQTINDVFELDPPYIALVSLIGISGTRIVISDSLRFGSEIIPDTLLLPPLIVEEPYADVDARLQPILDVLWQSAGFSGEPKGKT